MDRKALAEQAAEFLKAEHPDKYTYKIIVGNQLIFISKKSLFEDIEKAPILMALGKREMEKRGFIHHSGFNQLWHYVFVKRTEQFAVTEPHQHENEYIAFWEALLQAVRGE